MLRVMYIQGIMTWDGIDHRKFPRIRYKCFIKVSSEDLGGPIETFTKNIGTGGICVVLSENLGLFENVSLEVHFQDEKENTVKCNGTIVWAVKQHPVDESGKTTYDTGIEFSDLSPDNKKMINKIVESISHAELDNENNA